MFMSLISHALSAWFAFLLPSFSTYKALSHLPQSEPEVQRWGMYWSVVGAFVAFEYLLEWFISWFPFYWEVKTLFLLYLALPQTQGSTYIYQNYFRPWLAQNERALDDGIVAMQSNAFGFIQEKIGQLLNLAAKNQANNSAQGGQNGQAPAGGNPLATAAGLWQTFGGSVLGALNQHRPQGQAGATGVQANAAPANLTPRGGRSPAASAASTPSMERKDPPFPVPQVPQQYGQGYAQPQGYPQGYSKPY